VLSVNLTGVMLTDRAVARSMIAAGVQGTLVNIASTAARVPLPGAADYNVSKAGVAMLTHVLAVELVGHGIRVNAIAPGLIKTDFAKALWEDPVRLKRAEDKTPLRRIGDPVDIAGLAVFLSTPASAYITGQVIVADGGETIC
jgi:NAD(P)-dependent dehydrogenase (short-subunit alcohol dehydrogenase family)